MDNILSQIKQTHTVLSIMDAYVLASTHFNWAFKYPHALHLLEFKLVAGPGWVQMRLWVNEWMNEWKGEWVVCMCDSFNACIKSFGFQSVFKKQSARTISKNYKQNCSFSHHFCCEWACVRVRLKNNFFPASIWMRGDDVTETQSATAPTHATLPFKSSWRCATIAIGAN